MAGRGGEGVDNLRLYSLTMCMQKEARTTIQPQPPSGGGGRPLFVAMWLLSGSAAALLAGVEPFSGRLRDAGGPCVIFWFGNFGLRTYPLRCLALGCNFRCVVILLLVFPYCDMWISAFVHYDFASVGWVYIVLIFFSAVFKFLEALSVRKVGERNIRFRLK